MTADDGTCTFDAIDPTYGTLLFTAIYGEKTGSKSVSRWLNGSWPTAVTIPVKLEGITYTAPRPVYTAPSQACVYELRWELVRDIFGRLLYVQRLIPAQATTTTNVVAPALAPASTCIPSSSPWWQPIPDPLCR